jgi:hypothetical protein
VIPLVSLWLCWNTILLAVGPGSPVGGAGAPEGLVFCGLDYDYTTQDWFSVPIKNRKDRWSLPYFDDGGGNIWMVGQLKN